MERFTIIPNAKESSDTGLMKYGQTVNEIGAYKRVKKAVENIPFFS